MNDEPADTWQEKRPPMAILLLAALSVLMAYVLLLVFDDFGTHLAGYLLGSVVCTGLVAVFIKVDTGRRTSPDVVYLGSASAGVAWSTVLLAGLVACAAHAWSIATELAVR